MTDKPQHFALDNLEVTPPGSWRFFVKETGRWFRNYIAFSDLINDLKRHYKANELPTPPDLHQQVIDQICPELPAGWCEYAGSKFIGNWLTGALTFARVLEGTKALLSWQLQGRPKVPAAEAERRATICARCQYNVQPGGCPTCNSPLLGIVKAFVGASKTKQDENLRACKVCGCALKAKVWFPLDLIQTHMPEGQQALFPEWCWLARKTET